MPRKFKPCPFCGSNDINVCFDGLAYSVQCQNCFTRTGWKFLETEAAKSWNKRAEERKQKASQIKVNEKNLIRLIENTNRFFCPHGNTPGITAICKHKSCFWCIKDWVMGIREKEVK